MYTDQTLNIKFHFMWTLDVQSLLEDRFSTGFIMESIDKANICTERDSLSVSLSISGLAKHCYCQAKPKNTLLWIIPPSDGLFFILSKVIQPIKWIKYELKNAVIKAKKLELCNYLFAMHTPEHFIFAFSIFGRTPLNPVVAITQLFSLARMLYALQW